METTYENILHTIPNSVTYIHLHTPTHRNTFHSGHPPPPPLSAGEEVEPPTEFSKRGGGLTGTQLLEEDCWERGSGFFRGERGGAIFT